MENLVSEPVSTPVQIPKPKNRFPVIPVLLVILLLLLCSTAFLYYQNTQLKNMLANYQNQPTVSPTPIVTNDPTANWKIYTNEKYGVVVKYPNSYQENNQIPKTPELSFFQAFTSQDYETESNGPLSGATLNGSILTISGEALSPVDFVTRRCDYLKKGSPNLECQTSTILGNPLAIVSGQSPLFKTAFIEKDGNIISLHLETKDKIVLNTFDQILSTFKFTK